MSEDEVRVTLARLEERLAGLKEDIETQANRIDQSESNVRWVVLAVISVVVTAIMRLVLDGGA